VWELKIVVISDISSGNIIGISNIDGYSFDVPCLIVLKQKPYIADQNIIECYLFFPATTMS